MSPCCYVVKTVLWFYVVLETSDSQLSLIFGMKTIQIRQRAAVSIAKQDFTLRMSFKRVIVELSNQLFNFTFLRFFSTFHFPNTTQT
jgi:hypothetical protein